MWVPRISVRNKYPPRLPVWVPRISVRINILTWFTTGWSSWGETCVNKLPQRFRCIKWECGVSWSWTHSSLKYTGSEVQPTTYHSCKPEWKRYVCAHTCPREWVCVFVELEVKSRISYLLGKSSTTSYLSVPDSRPCGFQWPKSSRTLLMRCNSEEGKAWQQWELAT